MGCGRIGQRVLERLVPFNCKELLYYDYAQLPDHIEKKINAKYVSSVEVGVRGRGWGCGCVGEQAGQGRGAGWGWMG